MSTAPFVHVVMPTTHRRRWCLPRSIRAWLRQDYPADRWHLTVVDGGFGTAPELAVRDLIPDDPRVSYVFAPPMTLGEKFNHGIERAPEGALCMIAGDDDWIHPNGITFLAKHIVEHDVEITGSLSMLAYRKRDARVYLYAHPYPLEPVGEEDGDAYRMTGPYLIGGAMMFSRRMWARKPFPAMQSGSDSVFIRELLEVAEDPIHYVPLNEPDLYVAFVHEDNTGNSLDRINAAGHEGSPDTNWSRLDHIAGKDPLHHLRRLMGPAADEYAIPMPSAANDNARPAPANDNGDPP